MPGFREILQVLRNRHSARAVRISLLRYNLLQLWILLEAAMALFDLPPTLPPGGRPVRPRPIAQVWHPADRPGQAAAHRQGWQTKIPRWMAT